MTRRLLLALALACAATPAAAHHGWSTYDAETVLVFEAPIVESSYRSPHGELVIEVDGKRWLVILAPPARMSNRGLTAEDLAPGTPVVVEGYASTVTDGEMRIERISVNGKTVELR